MCGATGERAGWLVLNDEQTVYDTSEIVLEMKNQKTFINFASMPSHRGKLELSWERRHMKLKHTNESGSLTVFGFTQARNVAAATENQGSSQRAPTKPKTRRNLKEDWKRIKIEIAD